MYWTLNSEGKIWFEKYEYDVEKHIKIYGDIVKWGSCEEFDLHPDLGYWITMTSPSCGTDRECLCHESFESVFKYVRMRLNIDKEKEKMLAKINCSNYDKYIMEVG